MDRIHREARLKRLKAFEDAYHANEFDIKRQVAKAYLAFKGSHRNPKQLFEHFTREVPALRVFNVESKKSVSYEYIRAQFQTALFILSHILTVKGIAPRWQELRIFSNCKSRCGRKRPRAASSC